IDQQRGGLEHAVRLARDETGQAVDVSEADQFAGVLASETGDRGERARYFARPAHDARRGGSLAAAIGVEADVLGEDRAEPGDLPLARCGEEGLRDFPSAGAVDREARLFLADMFARAAGQLTAGGRLAAEAVGDLLE